MRFEQKETERTEMKTHRQTPLSSFGEKEILCFLWSLLFNPFGDANV